MQKKILRKLPEMRKKYFGKKEPFLLCSDEWYILANKPFPDINEYGVIDLVENGVGQVPNFLNRFYSDVHQFPNSLNKIFHITIVTGTLIADIFRNKIVPVLNKIKNLHVDHVSIENTFYGDSVTVSGLLTGEDIIKQLKNKNLVDEIWISHRILNDEGTYTLDNMTLNDISNELGCPVKTGDDSFRVLIKGLIDA